MQSVLVIGAHPDDETMLVGGTIALLTSSGVQVHILSATRGEGGEMGDPPLGPRKALGAIREQELRCAARALGASSVQFLGYVDPVVGPDDELYPFEADFDELVARIAGVIRSVQADVVLSHGSSGEYGHPAHRLVHRAVAEAIARISDPPIFYSFAAELPGVEDRLWNESDPAHLALDIRPWLDQKEAAARCHVTQHPLFVRNHPGKTIREALRKIETFHRHHPPVESGEPLHDPFADLLQAAGAWIPEHWGR